MAEHFQVSIKTFRKTVKANQIPYLMVGKSPRFDLKQVEAMLAHVDQPKVSVATFKPTVRKSRTVNNEFLEMVGL